MRAIAFGSVAFAVVLASASPIVFAATGVTLAATSAYFFVQADTFRERGDEIAPRIPNGEAPCEGSDPEFCSLDRKTRGALDDVLNHRSERHSRHLMRPSLVGDFIAHACSSGVTSDAQFFNSSDARAS
jgi:hypothetical protein